MKPFARDPFSLMGFHRVLIALALAFAIGLGWWMLAHRSDGHGGVVGAVISWAVAAVLIVYFWNIRRTR